MSNLKTTLETIADSHKNSESLFESSIIQFLEENKSFLLSSDSNSLEFTITYHRNEWNKKSPTVRIEAGSHIDVFETLLSFDRIIAFFKEADCDVNINSFSQCIHVTFKF